MSDAVLAYALRELSATVDHKPLCTALLPLFHAADRWQAHRFRRLLHGDADNGLLAFIARDQTLNAKRAYHYFKFLVELMHTCPAAEAYLRQDRAWEWVVGWLERQMAPPYATSYPPSAYISNEAPTTRVFTRTVSAQDTLVAARRALQPVGQSVMAGRPESACEWWMANPGGWGVAPAGGQRPAGGAARRRRGKQRGQGWGRGARRCVCGGARRLD